MSTLRKFSGYLGVLLACLMLMMGQAAYAGIAGNVQFVSGDVQVTNAAGQSHMLHKGDAIHESDTVTTAKGASAQIKMRDGGFVAVRPDSTLKFDSFVFSGAQDGTERSIFTLLKGGFRAITGLVGQLHKSSYRINTASSAIGIRGTDHETYVVVPGSEMAALAPAGTYNKVNVGETTMTTDKGTINILPNQMGFAAAIDQMPQLQPINLNIFTAVPSPALQSKAGQGAAGRESTVVDSVMRQNIVPANTAPANTIQLPVTLDRGPTAPPVVM